MNLQVIAEAIAGFDASGSNSLLDNKVETFDFLGLVERFDQARAANPNLTSWALSSAMLEFHTSGNDTAALGGDLAYQYGLNRALTGVGVVPAQSVLNDASFGNTAQSLNTPAAVHSGVQRLV